ncbi:MAG: EscU/YscU/HrcU family type III secretion system export apparatus switch protein [Clostridiales Family XIII bacterium]|jgi:flagellar biosynthesis protein|nr:EscU/YscU/HrcU family type III secretion system export apparatus switch protein [Clostridiales Family XIII bacterium]
MSESDAPKKVAPDLKAAALKYDADRDRAPQVVAAGSGYVAQKILQVAMENGISIYHDDSAATMLAKLGAGKEIPQELYQIVVNIYISLLDTADKRHDPRKYLGKERAAAEEAAQATAEAGEDAARVMEEAAGDTARATEEAAAEDALR